MGHGMEGLLMLSARAAAAAVSAGLRGVVLAAGVAILLRLVPGLTSAVRAALWSGVLLCVAALNAAPLAMSRAATPAASGYAIHVDLRWSIALAWVWAACSLTRGVGLAMSAKRLWRIARGATVVKPALACATLLQDGGGRHAELCVSDEVDRPSVAGFLHPRILLPPELLAMLPAGELEAILLHEMEHLRRRDDWVNLVQKVCLVLFPLNPALLWAERRVCAERELACDDRVLHLTRAPKAYATCLTNLAAHRLVGRGVSLALGAWERQTELARRVHRILAGPEREMSPTRARLAAALIGVGVMIGGAALARSPQTISFASAGGDKPAATVPVSVAGLGAVGFGGGEGRRVLVRAVMPAPLHEAFPRSKKVQMRSSGLRRGLRHQTGGRSRLVLVDRHEAAPPVPIARAVRISFAAVPFGNGWLIVQL